MRTMSLMTSPAPTPAPRDEFPVALTADGVSTIITQAESANIESYLSPEDIASLIPSQCKATNRKGEQCRRSSIPGAFVCIYHGGAAPQVRRVATYRWSLIQSLAQQILLEQLSSETATDLDPRAVLAIATTATDKRELLEGRATERREGMTRHEEVKLELQGKLADLSERLESLHSPGST